MPEDDTFVPEESRPVHTARGCYYVNILFNLLIACGFGIGIVFILNLLNRTGWFALLSGTFGALLYLACTLPRILFDRRPQRSSGWRWGPVQMRPSASHIEMTNEVREDGEDEIRSRRKMIKSMYIGIVVYGSIALAAFIGLAFLPGHQPIFAFLSAILGVVVCIALFAVVLWICIFLVLLNRHTHIHVTDNYIDF